MQFILMLNETPDDFDRRTRPDAAGEYWGGWTAFIEAMTKAGVVVGGNGLQAPLAATTLRLRDGGQVVEDGPFADTKEQLGGYFVIDVADLDAAIGWAAKAPCAATGSVEIRPVLQMAPAAP